MKKNFTGIFCALFLLLTFFSPCFGQIHSLKTTPSDREITSLIFGQTIERQIKDKDYYKVSLNAGEFVKIEVLQNDSDVVLMFMSPEKKNLHPVRNQTSGQGIESAEIAVADSGEYEIWVLSFAEPKPTSRYTMKIAEQRQATEKELNFTAGTKFFNEGFSLGTSNASAEATRQSILLFEKAAEKFRAAGDTDQESLAFNNIATRFQRLGNNKKAIEFFTLSLKGFRSINEKADESTQLRNLSVVYSLVGEWEKSFDSLFEALKIDEQIDNKRGKSFSLSKLGGLYEGIGDLEKAGTFYKKAADAFQELDENHNQALEINKIGRILYASDNFADALKSFEQAMNLAKLAERRKAMAVETGIKRTEAMLLTNIGRTVFSLGEHEKGLTNLKNSLEISRSLGDKLGEALTLRYLGQIHLKLGESDLSLELLNQSLDIYRAVEDTQNIAETLLLVSKNQMKKGDFEAAQNSSEEAIKLVETIRLRVQTTELRDSFSANLYDFYGFYIELLMNRHQKEPEKNYAALALEANERQKARGLLNLLAESNVDIREGVDEKLLQQETELKNLISLRLENLTKVLSGKSKPETVEKLKTEIEKIRAEFRQIQTKIRVSSQHYAELTQPKTLNLQEIQTRVLEDDSVLLEYALGAEKSFLWIVSKNDFQVIELPAKTEIEKSARQFYESLTARNKQIKFETADERKDRIFIADSDLQKYSKELGEKIIAPAAQFIKNKRLLIVSDGALQYVPFAALKVSSSKFQVSSFKKDNEQRTTNNEQFLVESNEIVNLPSASVLAVLRNETANRKIPMKTLAVLADPIFDKTDERFQAIAGKNKPKTEFVAVSTQQTRGSKISLTRDGLDLPRLPFTRREADLIGATLPENKREKLLDFAANKVSATSSYLSNFQYIHFATHGFINNENPELSGIVFSMLDEKGEEKDGFLRIGDIYNLKFPAEMVVLSGCRTGLGKEIKGEGLVGLTRGFMYAGAKRVTVSLWDVNDEATAELMARFYKEMFGKEKLSPAKSLRQAQISLIKSKEWNNPYFWSTFILQGEPQ